PPRASITVPLISGEASAGKQVRKTSINFRATPSSELEPTTSICGNDSPKRRCPLLMMHPFATESSISMSVMLSPKAMTSRSGSKFRILPISRIAVAFDTPAATTSRHVSDTNAATARP
ncbi:hypothetical protein TraAM80_07656, partial [Trypanosoma rangeli]